MSFCSVFRFLADYELDISGLILGKVGFYLCRLCGCLVGTGTKRPESQTDFLLPSSDEVNPLKPN
jgi:hypothetical protein